MRRSVSTLCSCAVPLASAVLTYRSERKASFQNSLTLAPRRNLILAGESRSTRSSQQRAARATQTFALKFLRITPDPIKNDKDILYCIIKGRGESDMTHNQSAHDDKTIIVSDAEPMIRRVTLNRPKFLNAYNHVLCHEVTEAVDEYMKNDVLRCLIITGAGRGFCGWRHFRRGADGRSHGSHQRPDGPRRGDARRHASRHSTLARCDKPVIAMVNGPRVAGGLALALACDFRVASDKAKLGDTSGNSACCRTKAARGCFRASWAWTRR